jgi:hypothetical protein
LRIVGTTLTIYVNAVSIDTRSDATFSTGQPGVWHYGNASLEFLSFTATDI